MVKKGSGWHKESKRHSEASVKGWNSRFGKKKVSLKDVKKLQAMRSKRAKSIDVMKNARIVGKNRYAQWTGNPARFDVKGVDTVEDRNKTTSRKEVVSNITNKLKQSEKIEKNMGRDYTVSATLKKIMGDLQAENPKKIKKITEKVDNYIKRGIEWGSESPKEVQDSTKLVYDYAMEKRKKVTPKIDTKSLDNFISFLGKRKVEPYISIKQNFTDLKKLFESPYLFGLFEETQFNSPKKELAWEIKLSKRKLKKDIFGLDEKIEKEFEKLQNFYK